MTLPSAYDTTHFPPQRDFVDAMRARFIRHHVPAGATVCEIGSHGGAFPELAHVTLVTLDLCADDAPDLVADITRNNAATIPAGRFDAIMCTEVLEHVVDPFAAVRELRRMLAPGGSLLVTTPLNARIHGPVPDCWRFTEFGYQVLFRDFDTLEFHKQDSPDRTLFPLHYAAMLRTRGTWTEESDPRALRFVRVD